MVQIRDSLPLLDTNANNIDMDSASLTASMAALHWHPDIKEQLATRKLITSFDTDSERTSVISEANIDVDTWLTNVANRIGQDSLPRLAAACTVVKTLSNTPTTQRSGVYATGIGMADILAYLFWDETALVAALLYRATRRELISIASIREQFGDDVAQLVADTLAMGRLSESIEKNKRLEDYFNNDEREHLLSIYSMLISTTNDVRAVLIKLAERTFAMRELIFASPARQQRVAREVMTIYAPLAHRLGIAQLKWELEDLAFRYLAPDEYKEIAKMLAEKRSEREQYIKDVQEKLKSELERTGIKAEVSGRVKHIYSIWRKMRQKNLSFDQLYDIRALRVLVASNGECYHTLGIVHGLWRHIPEQFDDYITNPKPNGYKSLHTAVIAEGKTLEIQIRTFDMHFEAELGMWAHVNYKEGLKNKSDSYLNQKINSLRQLLSGEANDDPDEDNIEVGNYARIYLFSRDGDIIELPKGATVLDFAYHVHTEVGNRAQGAKVNGRYVPLTYQPHTGEQIEIITKASREPNRDWLIPSLGYIYTNRARTKLRGWFNKQDRDKNIETGKQMLTKELERLSITGFDLNNALGQLGLRHSDDLYLALVMGEMSLHQVTSLALDKDDLKDDDTKIELKPQHRPNKFKIDLEGLDNVDVHLAKCCNPVHGEPIAGFITQSNGVSIHNIRCLEYQRLVNHEPMRRVKASWHQEFGRYQPVAIILEAYDRRGLLRDLTSIIDKENVNIREAQTLSTDDNIAHMRFMVEVAGLTHLSRLLAKLEQQPDVLHARRGTQ